MSGVVNFVTDVISSVVGIALTVTLIGPILSLVSDDFKDWYVDALAPVMSLLGVTDEDVISANVIDQLLLQDDGVKNLLTKVALTHQDTQQGIIELLAQYSMRAKSSMNNYFNYGENTYYNGLPDTNIRTRTIPSTVFTTIETEYSTTVNAITSTVKVPTKEEYIYWKFNKLYGYETWTNQLTYNGLVYAINYIDYNYGTDQYDVGVYRPATKQTEVTITITAYDATYDNKNTHTVITEHTIEGDILISDTSVDELIPIGTETSSYTTDTVADHYAPIIISIAAYAPKLNYVVRWYETNNGHIMYWCYEIGSGDTNLDSNTGVYVNQLEMLPIVEIRNNKININSNTESTEYLESKAILKTIGLDIDALTSSINENPDIDKITNSYVYFGLDAADTSAVGAKYMFQIFEFVYDQNMVDPTTHKYAAYTKEGNYNSTLIWREQTRVVHTGIIGAKGTYTSNVSGNTLILQHQATEEQYVEIQIIDVGATTFIYEGGMWATVQKTLKDGGVTIPISNFIANTMTPLEQMELFQKTLRLTVYAATVTHLEWYQTESFFNLIKIVVVIVSVVLAILSAPIGGTAGEWFYWAANAALMMGIAYAIKVALEQIDNPYLRMFLSAVVAIVIAKYQGMSFDKIAFTTVDQLTNMATEYYQMKIEDLQKDFDEFMSKAEELMKDLEAKIEDLAGFVDTEFVAMLSRLTEPKGYVEGVALMKYMAIDVQKDAYNTIKSQYDRIYDYDIYFRLGVV